MMYGRIRQAALALGLMSVIGYATYRAALGSGLERRLRTAALVDAAARAASLDALDVKEGQLRLTAPDPATAPLGPLYEEAPERQASLWAMAYQYDARVFAAPERSPQAIGIVRRGTVVPAITRVPGKGCKHGAWYALEAGGVVCTREGFMVSRSRPRFHMRQPAPDLNAALPYRYARVTTPSALRFHRIPTEAEEKDIAEALASANGLRRYPEVVQGELTGDYFVAVDRVEVAGERRFVRTIRGRYMREEDVTLREPPKMQGVLLSDRLKLPIAFVYGEGEAPLLLQSERGFEPVGSAEVHARFPLVDVLEHDHRELALGPDSFAVPRERVRVARAIDRPHGIRQGEKWIHVNLREQTLVAYEGDVPVFATLVSTGKEETGHGTPTGLFFIGEKHVTATMSGDDPTDGRYEVAEVPWTQFYDGSYALHGAYWHDTFGKTRSHGCTNLSPSDARWLFHWTEGDLPRGFHARRKLRGTGVYITSGAEDDAEGEAAS